MKTRVLFLLWGVLVAGIAQAQQQQPRWVPDYYIAQYAGSIGTGSLGIGYDVFHQRARWSFHYGYVPASLGGDQHIVTTKLVFPLLQTQVPARGWSLQWLSVGAMVDYHFGSDFASSWPTHRYPKGYYWWRTSFRSHLVAEQAVSKTFTRGRLRQLTAYLEWNAMDLYVVSYAQNTESLHLTDCFRLGAGIRLQFATRRSR